MNTLIALSPFLALIAFQSVEISAQAIGATYPPLASGGFVNGFNISFTLESKTLGEPYTIHTGTGGGCTLAQATADTCTIPRIQWESSDVPTITVSAELPPAADLTVPEGQVPESVTGYFCFAPPSAKNKKWRKINDNFKKDNSCKLSTILKKTDTVPYPAEGSTVTFPSLKLDPKAPSAYFSIRVYVTCEGAGKNEYCHVVNRWPSAPAKAVTDEVFFPTTVMDSRPTQLYVAVFICAFIGPVIFLAFMVYERGYLAKQA